MALPLASSEASAGVAQLMVAMFQLRQPLLTRHATNVLTCLAEAPSSHLPLAALAEILKARPAATPSPPSPLTPENEALSSRGQQLGPQL